MIIHRVRQLCHQARNPQLTRAIYVIIRKVRQLCHVLATKPGTYNLPGYLMIIQGETAMSHVSHQVHSHQEAEHL